MEKYNNLDYRLRYRDLRKALGYKEYALWFIYTMGNSYFPKITKKFAKTIVLQEKQELSTLVEGVTLQNSNQ